MKYLLFYILIIIIFYSCNQRSNEPHDIPFVNTQISDSTENACCPYLTKNHKGEIVIVYTAENSEKESYINISTWNRDKNVFDPPVKILSTKGAALHPESMAKAAFKSNGDIIVAFEVKKRTEQYPYAGEINYLQSSDNGKTWTSPALLHSDATEGKGRSFFDLSGLPNGEVGAVWLDASYPEGGRPVKFAQTTPETGFTKEITADSLACECCRTVITADNLNNKIHLMFRNLEVLDTESHIRDMALTTSVDGGKTFSNTRAVSNDNWKIVGCPHMGPAVSITDQKMHVAWFTAGGEPGIYYTSSDLNNNQFLPRQIISSNGKNPQLWAANDHQTYIVWSEALQPENVLAHKVHNAEHSKSHKLNLTESKSVIKIRKTSEEKVILEQLGSEDSDASFPVILGDEELIIVAWAEELNGRQKVLFKRIAEAK
jgi:hypothetical protein